VQTEHLITFSRLANNAAKELLLITIFDSFHAIMYYSKKRLTFIL